MNTIKVIFTGGTIGSLAKGNDISPDKETQYLLLEKYKEALAYAEKNIALNETKNVKTFLGDIFCGDLNNEKYDLIVSNPPYISEDEKKYLSKEVAFEPETALFAERFCIDPALPEKVL